MLPFLKPKRMSSTIISAVKKDGSQESKGPEDEQHMKFSGHAEQLIAGIHSKDANEVAKILSAISEARIPSTPDGTDENR